MKKWFSAYTLSRAGIFAAMVAIIVWFLPHGDNSRLAFTEGKPWTHPLLTAPFDIPVYHDSLTVAAMIDSIDREYRPVFTTDAAPRTALADAINRSGLDSRQRRHLNELADTMWQHGIMDPSTTDWLGPKQDIQLVDDNILRFKNVANVRTPRQAYAWLYAGATGADERRFLEQVRIEQYLVPNLTLDTLNNERLYQSRIKPVTAAWSVLQQGERIIDRGDIVTPQLATILGTYENIKAERHSMTRAQMLTTAGGQLLVAVLIMVLMYGFLRLYRPDIFTSLRTLLSITTTFTLFFVITAVVAPAASMGIFLVPFAMIPIVMVVFYDYNTALFVTLCELLVCACFTSFPLEFIFIETVVSCAAIGSMRDLSKRSQLLRTALVVFVAYILSYLAIEMMATASINQFSWQVAGFFAINMVLINFAYILILIYEKLFGLISNVTLVELCDINNPLLRKLSEQCPGTFQHCMGVSNLAANAASRIGANVQLIRTGALYHDIGKTENPAFFTENQYGVNPHDSLPPELSARVLHNHVKDGLRLASRSKLPRVVSDLIAQHHGTGLTKYFYRRYLDEHPGATVDEALFRYPGPNPRSREASLLMMADAVEAASRSLKEYSRESITELVNRIVDAQVAEGLHRESPLSFSDIAQAKEAFISRLATMYHSRISYPK